MEAYNKSQVEALLNQAYKITNTFRKAEHKDKSELTIPESFQKDFFRYIDKVNLLLMEDKDNFYGYFLFQMQREIRFDIASPTAVNFKGSNYVISFHPIIFLNLNPNQMESSIKHEILHILSLHLTRARELKGRYSTLAINMSMDIVVNEFLDNLPPYATTLEWMNRKYNLNLKPYQTLEYYVENLQIAIDLLQKDHKGPEDDRKHNDSVQTDYDPALTHDLWEESSNLEKKTLQEFTEKAIHLSVKGQIPSHVEALITTLKSNKGELPWNLYLHRLMGTVESNRKKTITRRNRRQPDRLDLRGELRSHKANIAVAIDISASISDEEFTQAIKEVLSIVKNYNHEITIIECDDTIKSVYKAKSIKDIRARKNTKGGTKFSPVFEYANHNAINLLIYFTDGKGENKLQVAPKGYQILWVISGRGDALSLSKPYGVVKKLSPVEAKDIVDLEDVASGGFSMNYHEKNI